MLAHPAVEEAFLGPEKDVLRYVEQEIGKEVQIRADASLHREQFEVLAV